MRVSFLTDWRLDRMFTLTCSDCNYAQSERAALLMDDPERTPGYEVRREAEKERCPLHRDKQIELI